MRILLAASASYDPPKGGSTRSNLIWLRALAARGHECLVVCGGEDRETVVDGVRIRGIGEIGRSGNRVGDAVRDFDPDFVLVSSEDLSHVLLREAHRTAKDRLVYLAHTPQWFPFGPEAWHPDAEAAALLQDALAIVSIGTHMASYIEKHLGRQAHVVHPAMYGEPPWPSYDNFHKQSILLINPCTAKGLPIYLELARRFPQLQFLALKGWGTTSADIAAMQALPNLEVLDAVPEIDEVFARSSLLLAPSLWYEGFGLVVTEAMMRGVPVMVSAHGGLEEAAASSRYRLPVRPIERWLPKRDETGMPVGVVEAQPVDAWARALDEMMSDEKLYANERLHVMMAARDFVKGVSENDLEALLHTLRPKRRRIYLIHNSTYFPGSGGGDKSNRLLMAALAREGHTLRVFTRLEKFGEGDHAAYEAEIARRGMPVQDWEGMGVQFELNGASVHVVTKKVNLRQALQQDIAEFEPDIILASTDDPAHLLLEPALQYEKARVVYLVRATIALPFGPDASTYSEERIERLRRADAIVGVSEYVARYCREEAGLDAVHVPISLSDDSNPPDVGRFENPYVTLVNPSAVKGLPILLGLADAMPETQFAAVPSWGTTSEDRTAMEARPNITLLPRVEDITDVLRQTRVTLVPSLWAEARSRMVLESLSRGVPVLASDVGGLREAMCGMDYVLPIQQIRHYKTTVSDQMVPEAEVPEQDLGPWVAALQSLVGNPQHWKQLHARGRAAALDYLRGLSVAPLEKIFRKVLASPKRSTALDVTIGHFSETKRKLLALRLEQMRRLWGNRAFPIRWGTGTKVFLFPWAAAGTQAWKFLREENHDGLCLIPALLPGREERAGQEPPTDFATLVPVLCDELATIVEAGEKFILAGHSMGGGLAFEVARELRRRGGLQATGLLVSSCSAPRLRRVSSRSEQEIPALQRSDQEMFSRHYYVEERPLDLPLTAMKGEAEQQLPVQEWGMETATEFRYVPVAGDHFWLLHEPAAFVTELRRLATR
ncbi:glycosyltransferase [Bryobacter aggregatus]|uniref:glycosyltransferase n=1 Tax=Bryobacter aggregatus TaxID=360054 RepID=UPI0004E1DA85|nr:glycosyltransferase [Bryobacter aggregatus]